MCMENDLSRFMTREKKAVECPALFFFFSNGSSTSRERSRRARFLLRAERGKLSSPYPPVLPALLASASCSFTFSFQEIKSRGREGRGGVGWGRSEMGASLSSGTAVREKSIHEFTVKDSRGKDVDLGGYKGKVLLVVNVASKCGFTDSNYTQLTELYNKYRNKDFEILAFPCNQFMRQEPGTSQEAEKFACTRYKSEYPIFQKIRVNGLNAAPVYKFLKATKSGFMGSRIKWNFTKFLVDKEGVVIGRYGPTTAPLSIEKDIQKALGEIQHH